MKKRFLVPFVVACLAFSSCSNTLVEIDNGGEHTVTDFYLAPSPLALEVGETAYVTANVTSTANPAVSWKVAGLNGIISIEETRKDGLPAVIVSGLSSGEATVIGICEDQYASCKVTVGGGQSTGEIPVTSITVNPTTKTFYYVEGAENTFSITSTVLPVNATNKTVTWSSSNTSVADVVADSPLVSENATVTVKATGTTNITAKAGNMTATCQLVSRIEGEAGEFKVTLSDANKTMIVDDSYQLTASAEGAVSYNWQSNNPSVASVNSNGLVTASAPGQATITVTASDTNGNSDTASCLITVNKKPDSGEYEQEISRWSKAGHLYIHYKRPAADYDKWAVWIWQKKPTDSNGSLWGASAGPTEKVPYIMSTHWMYYSDISDGGDQTLYTDEHGEILDIDLTNENIVAGETGLPSPLISSWEESVLFNSSIGFLIVDQTKMGGGTHWTSDGGIESYIEDLDLKFPQGKDSYLHIYCVQGSVSSYTTSSGEPAPTNPTATDTTGKYSSKNDINNLLEDKYSNVSTSETFKQDRPGTGYQIFVPSFADSDGDGFGDLRGIIEKLDYLEDLGIEVLWLTPIQKSGSYHGYDVTDYYKIDSKFGSMEDYQELIFKAHQKGMKVLMDMVINHTSKNNVLFTKSQRADVEIINGKEINYRNMYLWKFKGELVREWDGNVDPTTGKADPAVYKDVPVEDASDWYQDGDSNYYYYGKFGSGMAELNYSCQATRDYMTDMCKYWLSFGLDGFRLDAIKHIYLLSELSPEEATTYQAAAFKVSPDGTTQSGEIVYDASWREAYDNQVGDIVRSKNDYSYHRALNVMFWKDFAGTIKSAYPNCFLVGENFDGWNARISSFYSAIDSQFDFSTYYHLNGSTFDGSETSIANMGGDIQATLKWNNSFRSDHINGAFTSNHDVARFLNHAASTTMGVHHVEVNGSNSANALRRARWFGAITMLSPGVSWIYYGDEIGMSGNVQDKVEDSSGHIVDDHGNNLDRWYRQPMRWGKTQGKDNVVLYSFAGLEVNWDNYTRTIASVPEQQADENSLYNFFKALCHTKNDDRFPTYGNIINQWREGGDKNVLCMQISDGSRTVNVFINATGSDKAISGLNTGVYIGGSKGASATNIPAWGFTVVQK